MFYDRPETLPEALALLARAPRTRARRRHRPLSRDAAAGARGAVLDITGVAELRGIAAAPRGCGSAPAPPGATCATPTCRRASTRCSAAAREVGGRADPERRHGRPAISATPRRPPTACRRCSRSTPRSSWPSAAGARAAAARGVRHAATGAPRGGRRAGDRRPRAEAAVARARRSFLKLGARRYLVISIAMVAVRLEIDGRPRSATAAVAVGACSAVAQPPAGAGGAR